LKNQKNKYQKIKRFPGRIGKLSLKNEKRDKKKIQTGYEAHIGVSDLDLYLKIQYKNKCLMLSNAYSC
jgi:hypothetical protein